MVEQLSTQWWLRRDVAPVPMRLLLVGWRAQMRWESRDQNEACDPFLRLYWNRTPGAAVVVDGRRVPLRPDRLVAILPETRHYRRSRSAADHFFIHATCDWPGWRLPPGIHELALEPWFIQKLTPLIESAQGPAHGALERFATAVVASAVCQLPVVENALDPDLVRLSELLQPFTHHPGTWPGMRVLAQRLGWAERTCTRRFQQLCGQAPRAWISSQRIARACDLLAHGDASIDIIAQELGFSDRFHFTRTFTAARGCGPAQYRKHGLSS